MQNEQLMLKCSNAKMLNEIPNENSGGC
jgi:hypothetical protein